jgi:hypothetical protein
LYATHSNIPKHTVGTGALLGWGSFNKNISNTLGYGLKADYQYNAAKWFSIGIELGYTANSQVEYVASTDEFGQSVINTSKPSVFYAGIKPLLFNRLKKANIFAGFVLGVSSIQHSQTSTVTLVYPDGTQEIINDEWVETYGGYGLNPVVGVNFPLGNKRKPAGSLEFAFAYNRWLDIDLFFEKVTLQRQLEYRFIHAQITYRFNLY